MISYDYDEISDVLYAFTEEPDATYYDEVERGIYLRRDLRTGKLVGFMVINYSRRRSAGRPFRIPEFEDVELPF